MREHPWTAEDIPDCSGKVVIVTGANSGLGFESVKAFAEKGAQVVMAARSLRRAETAKELLLKEAPSASLDIIQLDLASLKSVKEFTVAFQKKYKRLDVLMNNAGIMMVPYQKTKDGFESQLGTNHLGHFALTGWLAGDLSKTPHSRVVNTASIAHRKGTLDFSNLQYSGGKGYTPGGAYGRSKLANLLFTYQLQRYFESKQTSSLALAAHPGGAETNLARHLQEKWLFRLMLPLIKSFVQSAAMGALPQLRAAVDPDVKGGEYFGPDGRWETSGYPVRVKPVPHALDPVAAEKLWQISSELTGVKFP